MIRHLSNSLSRKAIGYWCGFPRKKQVDKGNYLDPGMDTISRVLSQDDPDITVVKVYRPQDGQIQIHQSRVKPCPNFPAGFFWCGARRHGPGRPPKWIDEVLRDPLESQKAEQSTPASSHKEPIRTSSPHPSSNRRYNLRSHPQASTQLTSLGTCDS